MQSNTDWDTVTYLKKAKQKPGGHKSAQTVNAALRRGDDVETRQKYGSASNKKAVTSKNTAKLDRETEELHHQTISLDVGRLIQKGRQEKGLTQKELATKINEKPQIVNEYERGSAIPNNQIMGKLERAIGLKLRGKDKGKPIAAAPKKK